MTFKLGRLEYTIKNDALATWISAVIALEIIALITSELSFFGAVLAGVFVVLLHNVLQAIHQAGHATAARMAGHPMKGVMLTKLFSFSRYPKREGDLPDSVHRQRSLGGVVGTFVGLVIMIGLFFYTRSAAPIWQWVFAAGLIDAVVLFLVSAIYSDGIVFITQRGWQSDEKRRRRERRKR